MASGRDPAVIGQQRHGCSSAAAPRALLPALGAALLLWRRRRRGAARREGRARHLGLGVLVLAAAEARAQTYVRTLVPGRSDFCVVWPGREYVYHLDAAGSSRTPGTTEFTAIDAAVASWRALSAHVQRLRLHPGRGHPQSPVGYVKDSPDNQNVITFREQDCNDVVPPGDPCLEADTCANAYACWEHGGVVIGLTTTTFSFRTGYILDADIEFNAARARGPGLPLHHRGLAPLHGRRRARPASRRTSRTP